MFVDIEENQFPMHVTLYRGEDVAWEATVNEPGALAVPELGGITRCLLRMGDGSTYDSDQD